jgi:hypothetical protein
MGEAPEATSISYLTRAKLLLQRKCLVKIGRLTLEEGGQMSHSEIWLTHAFRKNFLEW